MTATPTNDSIRTHSTTTSRRAVALAAGLSLAAFGAAGCSNAGEGAFSGAALGTLAGLAIGSMSGNAGEGAAIGAIAGGLGGAIIADQNEKADQRAGHDPHRADWDRPARRSDDW